MASLRAGMSPFGSRACGPATQWQSLPRGLPALRIAPSSVTTRAQSTAGAGDRDAFTRLAEAEAEAAAQSSTSIVHARPLPVSPSYFSRQERFTDNYIKIQDLFRRYQHLPPAPPEKVVKASWRKLVEYKASCGEPVKAADYSRCIDMVKHLHKIHPDLKPPNLDETLAPFVRIINAFANKPRPIQIDKFGRALGVGRRKTSTARAWVVEGSGEVQVNGKALGEAFGRVHDRESATWALRATDRMDKYNVWALVQGGGTTGQAEAMTLAVAKALMAHEPALKPALRRAGCVARDPRMVERKKPGHVKARKMPAWVKR